MVCDRAVVRDGGSETRPTPISCLKSGDITVNRFLLKTSLAQKQFGPNKQKRQFHKNRHKTVFFRRSTLNLLTMKVMEEDLQHDDGF